MKAFLYLVSVQIRRVLQHRADALMWCVVSALRITAGLVVIFTVYSFIPDIEGFDRNGCILIFAGYSIVTSVFYMLFPWTLWYSRRYIIEGRLLTLITKPYSPLLFLIGENYGREELLELITNFLLFVAVAIISNIPLWRVALLVALFVPGIMTISGIFLVVVSIGSRSPGVEQAFSPLMSLVQFAQYPTSIYPRAVRFFYIG